MLNRFKELVQKGNPIGEVVKIQGTICYVKGLNSVSVQSHILFESGVTGMVKELSEDFVIILLFSKEAVYPKEVVVLLEEELRIPVGKDMLGHIVNPLGVIADDSSSTSSSLVGEFPNQNMPIFSEAPPLIDRGLITEQLETGVTIVDTLFPIAKGQRQAIVGDPKTGRTTFLRQVINNQASEKMLVVYVFIGKKRSDVNKFVKSLIDHDTLQYSIIVLTDLNDSSAFRYIAPYSGCAIAEYFWKKGKDVIIAYDDLSTHAKIYREISLDSGVAPGRESYPGDIYYVHSSLLERAGKLRDDLKGGTLTAFPVVSTVNSDITGYINTNVMSMTDGQIVFDTKTFKSGVRPAINAGISVSRIGKRTQASYHKDLATEVQRKLASYQTAERYSHFGSELVISTKSDLNFGLKLYELFKETPDDHFTLLEQQFLISFLLSEQGNAVALEEVPLVKTKIKTFPIQEGIDFKELLPKFISHIHEPS